MPAAEPGGTNPPPPWKLPLKVASSKLLADTVGYQQVFTNHEAASPPLYYSLAGGWWQLGRASGLDGGQLLYWLRFLNIPLVVLLVWLGWFAARSIFPESIFICIAVPALIAFMPQAAFYAINDDVLSPLTFGLAFVLLLKFMNAENQSPALAIAAGLALAAAYLTKTSNLPLLVAAGIFIALKSVGLARDGKLHSASYYPLLILLIAAVLPMAAWMFWCKTNFGDFTGSNLKIQYLGWTHKPTAEWLHHPIFSLHGFWYFLKRNLSTFWQGETLWHGQPLAIRGVDLTYVIMTLVMFAFTLVAWLRNPPPFTASQRSAIWLGFLCVAAAFAFFALLSVKYDFQNCFYPSHEKPFFVSGRLMLGMLVPFLILFACGLDLLTKRFQYATKFFVLLALLAFMLVSEITLALPVFSNDYNWFHL